MSTHRYLGRGATKAGLVSRPKAWALGVMACVVVQVSTAQTLDLLQVWERARQADPQMAAAQASRATAQALRQQADSVWRPAPR